VKRFTHLGRAEWDHRQGVGVPEHVAGQHEKGEATVLGETVPDGLEVIQVDHEGAPSPIRTRKIRRFRDAFLLAPQM
jgi:hypothetical protein